MSDTLLRFWERSRGMPRAMQWALWAAVGIGAFMIWDATLNQLAIRWASEADRIKADVEQVRAGTDLARELRRRDVAEAILAIGAVEKPGASEDGSLALSQTVNAVLAQFNVEEDSFAARPDRQLPRGTLISVVGGRRLESIKGDLNFIASPEDTISIISALESHPAIEGIRSIRLTKEGMRNGKAKLKVRMTLETWVISSRGERGRV